MVLFDKEMKVGSSRTRMKIIIAGAPCTYTATVQRWGSHYNPQTKERDEGWHTPRSTFYGSLGHIVEKLCALIGPEELTSLQEIVEVERDLLAVAEDIQRTMYGFLHEDVQKILKREQSKWTGARDGGNPGGRGRRRRSKDTGGLSDRERLEKRFEEITGVSPDTVGVRVERAGTLWKLTDSFGQWCTVEELNLKKGVSGLADASGDLEEVAKTSEDIMVQHSFAETDTEQESPGDGESGNEDPEMASFLL
jgi:hypothetical protein